MLIVNVYINLYIWCALQRLSFKCLVAETDGTRYKYRTVSVRDGRDKKLVGRDGTVRYANFVDGTGWYPFFAIPSVSVQWYDGQ
jgi:hypothetical protein